MARPVPTVPLGLRRPTTTQKTKRGPAVCGAPIENRKTKAFRPPCRPRSFQPPPASSNDPGRKRCRSRS
jgi:hypothetical protein